MLTRKILAATILLGGLGVVAAQDAKGPKDEPKPLDRAEVDRRAARAAFEVSFLGSELWKAQSYEGTFRLYQGTLLALGPMLDHRPKLQAFVSDRLEKARDMKAVDGAFVLREALDAIQKQAGESLIGSPTWVKLGGEAGVRALAGDFVLAVAADPKINITRSGKIDFDRKAYLRTEQAVVEFISSKVGGPINATGPDLKTLLSGLKLTDAEFDAMLGHLDAVLKKYTVPKAEADEVKKIFEGLRKDLVAK